MHRGTRNRGLGNTENPHCHLSCLCRRQGSSADTLPTHVHRAASPLQRAIRKGLSSEPAVPQRISRESRRFHQLLALEQVTWTFLQPVAVRECKTGQTGAHSTSQSLPSSSAPTTPLPGLQGIPGPLQNHMDHSLVSTYQPKAPQTARQAVLKGAATTRAAILSADALKHHPLHPPDTGTCACSISPRCGKKSSAAAQGSVHWTRPHTQAVSAAAQPRSAQGSSNTISQKVRDERSRRGSQLKVSRDLHSREYFSAIALIAGRPHPSLLLNTHCGSPKMPIPPLWDCRVCSANCTLQLCVWAGLGSAALSVPTREAWDIPDHG